MDRRGERILIVRLSALGDVVHTLPLARALRENRPDAFLGWAVEERYRELVGADPDVDLVLPIPRRLVKKGGVGWHAALRRARFDTAIDAQGLVKSAVVAFASGARRRIGFGGRDRRERLGALLTNERIAPIEPGGATHIVQKNLSFLLALRMRDSQVSFPKLFARDPPERNRIVLHPGAGWESKRWLSARFAELGDALATGFGCEVLVTWGPGDEEAAHDVANRMRSPKKMLDPCGPMGLAHELAGSRLAVGGDTGPIHLAAALGVPTVSLFGPSDPRRNGPIGSPGLALWADRPCRGCWKHRCPRGLECVAAIPIAEVLEASRLLLARASELDGAVPRSSSVNPIDSRAASR